MSLGPPTCEQALRELVNEGFLVRAMRDGVLKVALRPREIVRTTA